MVDPAATTPASGGLVRALLARKGEAAPALPAQTERLVASGRCAATAAARPGAGTDSPLAFLISRRPASAAAVEPVIQHETGSSTGHRPALDRAVAAEPRRTLTVRLHHRDFLRLRAVAEASGATYQSLIEAGVLRILATDPGETSAGGPAAGIPSAKRRSQRD
ncbi:MAG: hypothetical protein U1E66_02875 [Rhodospirillales bacterium]